MLSLKRASIVLALSALFGTVAAQAQTSRGTVTGVVVDQSKASVPGATVEITHNQTNVTRSTTTNEQGVYRFDAVDLGTYNVVFKAQGFKSYTSREVPVSAAQVVAVDARLEVGDAVSMVEVTSDAIALQTEAPVRGGNLTSTQITQLPTFSRNPNMLAITLPGVTEQRSDLPGISTFSVNGARGRSNNFLLDGTENNDISVAGQGFQVKNPNAVQEVSVQTTNFDAEFGRSGGAVVNTITKSGTNDLHGTLGWVADFTNDDAITNTLSNDPKIKARGKLPPGYEQYYNGTLGGPVVRERTFFFTSWQEQRRRATNTATFLVPTAAGRQTLRDLFPAGRNPRADLYLDVTQGVVATPTAKPTNIDLGGGRGNMEVDTGVLAFPYKYSSRQSLSKIDHRFSDNDLMAFRYAYENTGNPTAGVNFPGFFTSQQNRYHNIVLTETHVFSPAMTNELRLPYNRISLEFPNDAIHPAATSMPVYNITGVSAIGVAASFPQGRVANNFQLQDTLNWVRGKHSLRFGFDLLQQRSRQAAPVSLRGQLNYRDSLVGQRYSAFGNFLDDYAGAGGASRDFGSPTYYPELFRQAYFVQDRWQIRNNFTLTFGLRWEDFGTPANSLTTPAYTGLFNVQFDPATKTWSAPMTEPNKTNSDLNNFSPNLGITWSPSFDSGILGRIFGDRKSVFRAGYTINYDAFYNNIASNAAASSPNLVTTTVISQTVDATPRGLAGLSTSIPNTPRAVLPTDSQNMIVEDLRNPYIQRWNFGIQRELPWGLLGEAFYVGSAATRLYLTEDLNPEVVDTALSVLPAGYTSYDQLKAAVPYPIQPRLDPLQGIRYIRTNGGHSTYHSGQFSLDKRFSSDLGFKIAYTWSKMLDNASEISTYNNSTWAAAVPSPFGGGYLEKAVSLYDRPYRLTLTYNYTLPFLKSQNGLVGRILGGWQIAGLTTFESGVPFGVTNGADADGLGGAADRPMLNPRGKAGVRARPEGNGYVNPDVLGLDGKPVPIDPMEARYIGLPAWKKGQPRVTGNAGRNTERTPGINNTSLNLIKTVSLTERFKLAFGGELYNVFNHPQYGYKSVSEFAPAVGTTTASVNTSNQGRFLRPEYMDGGGRVVRYNLTLRF